MDSGIDCQRAIKRPTTHSHHRSKEPLLSALGSTGFGAADLASGAAGLAEFSGAKGLAEFFGANGLARFSGASGLESWKKFPVSGPTSPSQHVMVSDFLQLA